MPIKFSLEDLRVQYDCKHYFETGLWDPRQPVSSKQAILAKFDTVHCIELRDEWIHHGKNVFKKFIDKGRYYLYHDDSVNMQKYLSEKPDIFKDKTIFFLDAHVDNQNIHNFQKRCPLIQELTAIGTLERKDNIILVDDLRILKTPFPWGETTYGNIDFLSSIKDIILKINPEYKFKTLPGHIQDDVLCAYV